MTPTRGSSPTTSPRSSRRPGGCARPTRAPAPPPPSPLSFRRPPSRARRSSPRPATRAPTTAPAIRQAVDDPASQPWVTGVGASSIQSSGETRVEQQLRRYRRRRLAGVGAPRLPGAAAQPQSAVTCGAGATTCREVPDVTADGDPTPAMSSTTTASGTRWAARASRPPRGPRRPPGRLLPGVRRSPGRLRQPRPVQAGRLGLRRQLRRRHHRRQRLQPCAGFSAGPGYDMASGLGTPNARSIVPALCGGSPIPARRLPPPRRPPPRPRRHRRPGQRHHPRALAARSSLLGTRLHDPPARSRPPRPRPALRRHRPAARPDGSTPAPASSRSRPARRHPYGHHPGRRPPRRLRPGYLPLARARPAHHRSA